MSDHNVLFLTSFNDKLYDATGKKLLKSFIKQQVEADFLITYEGFDLTGEQFVGNTGTIILCINIEENRLLREWEENNKDIIPKHYGGLAGSCHCPFPKGKKDKDHVIGCHYTWWNRNCSRWFRKIVTLDMAKNFPYEYLIWIDSDCEFKTKLTEENVRQIFENYDYFYLKGKSRPVDETGLFGIKNNLSGKNFIKTLVNRYVSGKFRYDPRWDDSYQLMMTRIETKIKQKDLVLKSKEKRVVDVSPFNKYLVHNKGTHGRILGIMK